MSEQQDQVIQEQGAEPQTQQPAVKFPVLGSASAKLTSTIVSRRSLRSKLLPKLANPHRSSVNQSPSN